MTEPHNPDHQPETHQRHDFANHRRAFALNQVKELREVLAGTREAEPIDPWEGWEPGQA